MIELGQANALFLQPFPYDIPQVLLTDDDGNYRGETSVKGREIHRTRWSQFEKETPPSMTAGNPPQDLNQDGSSMFRSDSLSSLVPTSARYGCACTSDILSLYSGFCTAGRPTRRGRRG